MAKNLNPDKPETMTIENCMKDMTSRESTIEAVQSLIDFNVAKYQWDFASLNDNLDKPLEI